MLFGGVDKLSGQDIVNPTTCVGKPLGFRQIILAPAQRRFRLLQVVDINIASIPTEHASGVVKQRESAFQEPPVFSIEPPETGFYLQGFPFRHGGSPFA